MREVIKIRDLHSDTSKYLDNLIELIRAVSRTHELLDFINFCIDYAEANIPHQIIDDWSQSNPIFTELIRRSEIVYEDSPNKAIQYIYPVEITAGSALADTYSFILNNISHIDGEREKQAFYSISEKYNQIINGEEENKEVHSFLYRLNPLAASKFIEGAKQLTFTPQNEATEDPLSSMRSALNLTIRTLIDLTGDTTIPKQAELIPRIAKVFAKDQAAQVDLAIRNRNFLQLWLKLSKTKDMTINRDLAMGFVLEATSILILFSRTIKLPRGM